MAVHVDRRMRLPAAEFFPGAQRKSGIALHHTVGGTAKSTFGWWLTDHTDGGGATRVGTAASLPLFSRGEKG